jgi:hypothetical protein
MPRLQGGVAFVPQGWTSPSEHAQSSFALPSQSSSSIAESHTSICGLRPPLQLVFASGQLPFMHATVPNSHSPMSLPHGRVTSSSMRVSQSSSRPLHSSGLGVHAAGGAA